MFKDDPAHKARTEDDFIAYTWDKFLRTGDEKWPLRLPMTKAATTFALGEMKSSAPIGPGAASHARSAGKIPARRPFRPKLRYGPQEAGPMSAPNKNYDPKATASLAPDEVARVLDEALAAVAAAGTLDELKAARIAHEGDRAPLSLASAEIGALPPEARRRSTVRSGAARVEARARGCRSRAPLRRG